MDGLAVTQPDPGGAALLGEAPMLLVAERYASALRGAIEATGRVAVGTGFAEAVRQFDTSAASLVLVDTRGGLEQGLATMRALALPVRRRGAALVALLPRDDPGAFGQAHDAGATHIVASGVGAIALETTLRSAERYVRRLRARGDLGAMASAQAALVGGARWQWRRGEAEIDLSPALAAMFGERTSLTRMRVLNVLGRIHPTEREGFARALARLARSGRPGELSHRLTIDGASRTIVHHIRSHRDGQGRLSRLSGMVEDLDAVLAERRLSAHFDSLTGLANASFVRDWIDQLVGDGSDYDPACIVLMLSLTRFDGINAAYGRAVADGLLQAVARRLRRVVGADKPEARVLARIAGAEFVVAFAGPVRLGEVTVAARRLGDAFARPFTVKGNAIHLACRMGLAVAEEDQAGADVLLRRASAALARAKAGEPNSFEVFGGAGHEDLLARAASLGDDLRAAIAADAIDLLYQPVVDVVENRIVGVEALVRWRHPTLGLLPAETLVEVAERTEIGPRLGEYILLKALREAAAWPAPLANLRLSVNATADDLTTPDFADRVIRAVERSGFPRGRLTIEATESGLMRDIGQAARALSALRTYGLCVAIDDFGTGYSSLAYLSALPADYLKIDKSLIVDLFGSARDRVVVSGVVDIARRLELTVIAEGVETDEQRIAAAAAGCQLYQGFLCSRAVSGAALAGLVSEWNSQSVAADLLLANW